MNVSLKTGDILGPSLATQNQRARLEPACVRGRLRLDWYDFVRLIKTKTIHNEGVAGVQTVERKFNYDNAGRITKIWHNRNNTGLILLAMNEYNELGQLIDKKLHNTDLETTADASRVFKQSVDYRYNIRGWLKSINDLAVTEVGDLFGMNLNYNTPTTNIENAQFNGNISEILWKSADGQNQSYQYTYDQMNRLVEGKYYNGTNVTKNNRFNEKIANGALSGYDLNGNIKFLQRQGKTGVTGGITTYGLMDDLKYNTYDGNQLLKIVDDAIDTEGFVDGVNSGNDYAYDVNGNMYQDQNKLINDAATVNGASRITYNYLNLVDKVVKSNGDYLKYIYDATGRKLSQVVYNASNVQQKRTDYAGEFIYEGTTGTTTLQFINHEEGRIIPTGNEYQYHIKDHLGNVRVTFTPKQETTSNLATFESANRVAENLQFDRYDRVRIVNSSALFDHTNGTANGSSIRLSGSTNEKTGLVKTISVMPGDVINMEVWAKYLDKTQANWTPQLLQIVSPIMSGTTGIVTDGSNYPNNPSNTFPYTGLNNTGSSTGLGPKAYLNYIFFDRDFVATLPADDPSQTFYVRVPETAKESGINLEANPNGVDHALLSASVTVKKAGYLYIYLSNEEETPVEVYFDDFKVTQAKSPVVQMDDYYPFGLTFNSYNRENSVENKRLYNGGSERTKELDLNVYETFFRILDPTIARWWQLDPKPNDSHSLYISMNNNPIFYNDVNGDTVKINLFDKEYDSKIYHETADNSVKNEVDDGVFLVFAHGHSGVVQYTGEKGNILHATNGKEFIELMSSRSPAFKKAIEDNKSIVLHLNACNVVSEEYVTPTGDVKKRENTIAEDISKELPKSSKVIAPDGYWQVKRNRVRQTDKSHPENTGKGGFVTIIDGAKVSKRFAPAPTRGKSSKTKSKPADNVN